jgi:hypothetical protein
MWPKDGSKIKDHETLKWLYEAKEMAGEVPRLTLLFKLARTDGLAKVHQQCSHAEPEPVPQNHLTCCLGVKCHECPELLALEKMEATPEQIDEAKAWTCCTHIAFSGGDVMREGYLLTVDDRMYWDRLYSNLAQTSDPDGDPEETP